MKQPIKTTTALPKSSTTCSLRASRCKTKMGTSLFPLLPSSDRAPSDQTKSKRRLRMNGLHQQSQPNSQGYSAKMRRCSSSIDRGMCFSKALWKSHRRHLTSSIRPLYWAAQIIQDGKYQQSSESKRNSCWSLNQWRLPLVTVRHHPKACIASRMMPHCPHSSLQTPSAPSPRLRRSSRCRSCQSAPKRMGSPWR